MTSDKGPATPGAALRDLVVEKVAEKVAKKADRQERIAAKSAKKAEHLEKIAGRVNEKAAHLEKVAGKVTEKAERAERLAAKAAKKAEAFERISTGLGVLDLWTRDEPTARRPRFTRDEIATTAMRIADAEGFAALSMRRLAAELDAGTMTLYHYVRTKDEVLTLVVDAVMGEVVLGPDEVMPTDWRAAITMIAERSRDSLRRHPWILDIADDPPVGPNSVRHFDQSLQAVASLELSLTDRFDIVSAVDEYVFGFCLFERNNLQPSESPSHMSEYVNSLVETGDYPQLAALADEYGLEQAWAQVDAHLRDADRFGRNLGRLLDGIEVDLARRVP